MSTGTPARRLVIATHNDGKVRELLDILSGLDVDLLSAADVHLPDVEETGSTFADNALLKARAGVLACDMPCTADDSGLVVDALGGAPGVHSARYAALHGDDDVDADVDGDGDVGGVGGGGSSAGGRAAVDQANLRLLLRRMAGTPAQQRTARFVCAAALVLPDGREVVVEAAMEGLLLDAPRGAGGFGYDPIFVPLGHEQTTAEMPAEDKHAISHRGQAFRRLRPHIADLLAGEVGPRI